MKNMITVVMMGAPEKGEALLKSITIVDSAGRAVEVPQPLERIAIWDSAAAEVIRALGAKDKIIGIAGYMARKYPFYWADLMDRPTIGAWYMPDYQRTKEIEPQVVITITGHGFLKDVEKKLEPAGIKVVKLDFHRALGNAIISIKTLGLMLGKEKEAEEFTNFLQSKIDLIEERVKDIKPEERKRVYWEDGHWDYHAWGVGIHIDDLLGKAGGINIFADLEHLKHPRKVDTEEILVREPDVVIKGTRGTGATLGGYTATNTSKMKAKRDEMMSRPGWSELKAVKNGQVYIESGNLGGLQRVMNLCYVAKLLYPDRFEDLDVEAFHREYLEKYQGLEFKGIYVYPKPF